MIKSAKACTRYDKLLIQNLTSNPKALYGYIRDKNKVKTSIDGSLTDGDNEVAETLNHFFQSVFTKEDPFYCFWGITQSWLHIKRDKYY